MTLQTTDLFVVERGGVQYQMTASQIADFVGAVKDFTAADITARDALSGLSVGDRVFVVDASADGTVDSGWAIYRVGSTGPIAFDKIQEGEGLDVVAAGSDLGYTAAAGSGTVTNSNGTPAVIPAVTATEAGLATPAMFTNSHGAASAGGTAQSNPVVVNGSQQVSFNITQLTALP